MTQLLANRRARRRGILFTVLVAITLLLMAFSGNPYVRDVQHGLSFALRPLQVALASAADGLANVAGAITEIDRLRVDNGTLRDENEALRNENSRVELLRRENDQLTALLQLRGGLEHKTVAVRVIGRESLETRRVVVIDRGTADGIAVGDSVVVQGAALAGRVSDAGPGSATVTLVSDGSSTVVGQLASTGATGEVVGQAGDLLVMRNIDSAVRIPPDEEVFTAGLQLAGGIRSPYPKGLALGRVVDVKRDANDVVQTAFLAPAADLATFEVALVITDYEGGVPSSDGGPVPCGTDATLPEGEVPCYTPLPTSSARSSRAPAATASSAP